MFEIELCLEQGLSWPNIQFNHPAVLVESVCMSDLIKKELWRIDVNIGDIELNYINKSADETVIGSDGNIIQDQTVAIENCWYQGIKIHNDMLIKLGNYYPCYRNDFLNYCNENNIVVDHGPLNCLKFWHAGSWKFNLCDNFWPFYAQQRKMQNIQASSAKDFVGYSTDQIVLQLKKLKEMI